MDAKPCERLISSPEFEIAMMDQHEFGNSSENNVADPYEEYLDNIPVQRKPYHVVYVEPRKGRNVPVNVPQPELALWVGLCLELRGMLEGMLPNVKTNKRGNVTSMNIRNYLCSVLDGDERLFRVLKAVLVRTVSGCPALEDIASLKKELQDVKSAVRSKMESILQQFLKVTRGGAGAAGAAGGASGAGDHGGSSASDAIVRWRREWGQCFNRVWSEARAACGLYAYVVFPSLFPLSFLSSDASPHRASRNFFQGDGRAQSVQS